MDAYTVIFRTCAGSAGIAAGCLSAIDYTYLPLDAYVEILTPLMTVFRSGAFGMKSNHHKVMSLLAPT